MLKLLMLMSFFHFAGEFYQFCCFKSELFYLNTFFSCQDGYHGRRCENIYHEGLFAFIKDKSDAETAALSILVVLAIIGIFFISFMLYYYRRYSFYLYCMELSKKKFRLRTREGAYTPSTVETSRGLNSLPRVSSTQRFVRFQHQVSQRYPTYYVSVSFLI